MAVVRSVLCRAFVGRREELAFLRERRLEASASHGNVVLIAGDAGVGKSRLIAEFCDSLAYSKWRIVSGPCLEFARRPYGPILDILARLDAHASPLIPALTKHEQFDAIVDRFAQIASRTALVIVVEDLHWADAATLDLLAYLGTKIGRMRILVLASFRADELHPDHPATPAVASIERAARAGRIDLAPLAGGELRTFITEALAGYTLPDETRRAIAIAGDGNPFFTEELLKSAVEKSATHADTTVAPTLPKTVRATLLERLRPFDDDERRIVTQAAVIGRTFSVDLLAATLAARADDLLPTLRRARDFQLIEEVSTGVFRFRHGLTREAMYDDFLGAQVQPMHRTIVHALENELEPERFLAALAYHAWAAGDASRSLHYNERAGDAAGRVHAHEDAIACYERALQANEIDAVVRGSLVRKIADRRQALGWLQEARAKYVVAADIFCDARAFEQEAGSRVDAAISAYKLGIADPTADLLAMLERLAAADYAARSRVHAGLAWLAASYWFPTRAAAHLAAVDERALDALDLRLRVHNVAAWVAMTVGDVARFRSEHTARLEAARASGLTSAVAASLSNGAACFSMLGLHDEARTTIDLALRNARAERGTSAEEAVQAFAAMSYLAAGDLGRARAAVEAVSVTTESQPTANNALAAAVMVGAHLDDRSLIEKWFDGFEAIVLPDPETSCGGPFAEILVRRGRQADAARLLHRALPACERVRGNLITLLAVARYGHRADHGRAREQLAAAADAPSELVERHGVALFDALICSRNGDVDEARTLARGAADGFRRLRYPLLEAEALELAGDIPSALAVYRRCGATYHVRRLEGGVPAVAIGDRGALDAASMLSKREREIAALAARGVANLDIARELSISHKTVEKHLASVYQKLQISSRKELGAHVAGR